MTGLRAVDYLDHMADAARLACSYVERLQKADFLSDKRTQQAVILNILVIGEAATRLTKEHPELASASPTFPGRA